MAKASITVSNLLLIVLIGREAGASGVGLFTLTHGFLLLTATASRFGTNNSLIKFVNVDKDFQSNINYLLLACTITLTISVVLSVVLKVHADWVGTFYDTKNLSSSMTIMMMGAPAFSISIVCSGYFKGLKKNVSAIMSENGMVSLLTVLMIIFIKAMKHEVIIHDVIVIFSINCWLVLFFNIVQISFNKPKMKEAGARGKIDISSFLLVSRHFYFHSFTLIIQSSIFVLTLAYFVEDAEVGLFRAAQQLSVLISFSLLVVNIIYPAKFSEASSNHNKIHFQKKLSEAAAVSTVIGFPAFFACLIFPNYILGFMGSEFVEAGFLLQIFAFGQLINILTGSAGFALGMGNCESIMAKVSIFSSILGLLLCAVLTYLLGVLGGVIAFSSMIILQNVAMFYFCWSRLGLISFPLLIRNSENAK